MLLLACAEPPSPPPAPRRPPDVLLVVLDTVRADATSLGGARDSTPNLAKLAARGAWWSDVTSPGTWSWPGHASLFTGEPPWVHGAHFAPAGSGQQLGPNAYQVSMPDPAVPMLAEELGAAGYETACFTANLWLERGMGLDRGFDTVFYDREDPAVVEATLAYLDRPHDKPLFTVVNLFGAHAPLEAQEVGWLDPDWFAGAPPELAPFLSPPKAIDGYGAPVLHDLPVFRFIRGELALGPDSLRLWREVYDSEVWLVDRALGVLLNAWYRGGRADSVVAVTSDHGEYLGEHGRFDHGRDVHPEVTAVPMVVVAPGRFAPGTRIDIPASSAGVHGSLLEAVGLPRSRGARLPTEESERRPVSAWAWADTVWIQEIGGAYRQGYRAWREGALALRLGDDGSAQLFDHAADPGWTRDLAAERPGDLARLRAAAEAELVERVQTPVGATVDEETRKRLESLGYVAPR